MIKLNNKGQSLVMFVLIIPILLLIMILVIDVGNMVLTKQSLDNTNYLVIDYALEHIDDKNLKNNIKEIIKLNDDRITIVDIKISNEKVYIETKRKSNGFLSKAFNLSSSYEGCIENGSKKIKKG